jgi:AbrB family looped-hinge helix DNA binding protein
MNENLPGTRIAERLMARPHGATMDEIVAATGGPQYNVLGRLEARGYRIRKVKEGKATRYFAEPPAVPSYQAKITGKGQVTIPQEVRERLRLRRGHRVQFIVEDGGRVLIKPVSNRLSDLAGCLPKPKRTASLEEMDDGIRRAVAERYRRARR